MKLVIVDDDCLVSSSLKTILEAGGGNHGIRHRHGRNRRCEAVSGAPPGHPPDGHPDEIHERLRGHRRNTKRIS